MSKHSRELPAEAAAYVKALELEPLPHEGGLYRQNHQDQFSTALYYLLADPEFSALHQLDSPAVYHWSAGDPLLLPLLNPDRRAAAPVVRRDVLGGPPRQDGIPPRAWHGC